MGNSDVMMLVSNEMKRDYNETFFIGKLNSMVRSRASTLWPFLHWEGLMVDLAY